MQKCEPRTEKKNRNHGLKKKRIQKITQTIKKRMIVNKRNAKEW